MSIRSTDNLSLLASLPPLRQSSDNKGVQQNRGFSERLDKALSTEAPEVSASEKARAMAELLTLQMLQTSLSLAGDDQAVPASASALNTPMSSANALIQAYRAGMAESLEKPITATNSSPAQPENLQPAAELRQNNASPRRDPEGLDPIIARASRRYGVDAGLIKAVIKAESNFNPQAVSHAGAQGLMQLMPATARSLGVSNSFDPEQNVMAGTRFLRDMLQRYNGNIDSALAAYNWGPGNVDKRPDHLPRETRDYLSRVKQLYTSYTA